MTARRRRSLPLRASTCAAMAVMALAIGCARSGSPRVAVPAPPAARSSTAAATTADAPSPADALTSADAPGPADAPTSADAPSPTDAPTTASDPPPSVALSAVPDPCTLLTLREAKSLAGTTLSAGQDVPAGDPESPASCTYTAPPTSPSGQVELYVSHAVPRAYQIDLAVKHRFRTVAGIGDQTVEEPDNNNIFVRKGQLWVYLSIPFGATPAAMERGARLIAARLP